MRRLILLCITTAAFAQPPAEKERALGHALAVDIERQSKMLDDAVVTEYIARIARNLAPARDGSIPLTVKVIDSQDLCMVALPGGFLFVNSGVVARTETEAELAGVIAHEIGHMLAHQRALDPAPAPAGVPLVFMGNWLGLCSRFEGRVLMPAAFQSAQRSREREADSLGLDYVSNAGYDPRGLLDAFARFKPGDEELQNARVKIQQILAAQPNAVVTTSEFVEVKKRLSPKRKAPPSLFGTAAAVQ